MKFVLLMHVFLIGTPGVDPKPVLAETTEFNTKEACQRALTETENIYKKLNERYHPVMVCVEKGAE